MVYEFLTMNQFLQRLREMGRPCNYYEIRQDIIDGKFPFASAQKRKRWVIRIDAHGLEEWAAKMQASILNAVEKGAQT